MFKRIFGLILLFSTATQLQAREWINQSDDNSTSYLIEYEDDGMYALEMFQQPLDGYQEKIGRFVYGTTAERDLKLNELLTNTAWTPVDSKSLENKTDYVPTEVQDLYLWVVQNEWNEYWENAYADWVNTQVGTDFFQRYNLRTDCADVGYSLRWIFSRINKLPMGSRLAGSRVLITQDTMRTAWSRLPTSTNWYDDQRFRAALDYILDNTFTHTLWEDTYPIAVNANTFKPGTIILYKSGQMGHTRIVKRIGSTITLMSSTIPRAVRGLHAEQFSDGRFPSEVPGSEYGILKIRWMKRTNNQWQLLEKIGHPEFSMEQFASEYRDDSYYHYQVVLRRLQQAENPVESFMGFVTELKGFADARPQIVNDGFAFCQSADCAPGTANYEEYSTPSRDGRLKDYARRAATMSDQVSTYPGGAVAKREFDDLMATMITYKPGVAIQFSRFVDLLMSEICPATTSSDPRKTVDQRWCQALK